MTFIINFLFIYLSHINGNGKIHEEEEEEQEEEEQEQVVEARIELPKSAMNARKWKWEVTDD